MDQILERRQVLRLVGLASLVLPIAALAGCAAEGQHPRHLNYGGGGPNQDGRGERSNGGGGGGGGGGGR